MKIKSLFQNVLFILAIYGSEAKVEKESKEIKLPELIELPKMEKVIHKCKDSSNCSNIRESLNYEDSAYCNVTDSTCTNYCFLNIPCFEDFDCKYSIGDPKKCVAECYKLNNDTAGVCLVVSKQGQYCGESYIVCEDDLVCDYYTGTCITKAEAQSQTGEPLFSLFLFMLIMLSLFNRQRADEDILNNMAPNELLMVTLPSRRHNPEDDILPVYQPLDDNTNEDEVIEQNLVVPESEEHTSSEINQSTEDVGIIVDDDDLPLLPPTYDEAVSGFDSNESLTNNNNEQNPSQNNNSS
jgi:hypothetical protein